MPKPPMISTEDAAEQQGRRTFAAQDLACHRPSGRHRGAFQGSKFFLGKDPAYKGPVSSNFIAS